MGVNGCNLFFCCCLLFVVVVGQFFCSSAFEEVSNESFGWTFETTAETKTRETLPVREQRCSS